MHACSHMNTRRLSALALALAVCLHVASPRTHLKLLVHLPLCLQLGESLEEQLGQRLLRMPPPPQLPPRVRQGQQHMIEQQQQPSMFQLPYEVPPVLTDPMQVWCADGQGAATARAALSGVGSFLVQQLRLQQSAAPFLVRPSTSG